MKKVFICGHGIIGSILGQALSEKIPGAQLVDEPGERSHEIAIEPVCFGVTEQVKYFEPPVFRGYMGRSKRKKY